MPELPSTHFDDWTLEQVQAAARGGTRRRDAGERLARVRWRHDEA
jgi:hypothetical protein